MWFGMRVDLVSSLMLLTLVLSTILLRHSLDLDRMAYIINYGFQVIVLLQITFRTCVD